jgi:hypothetical protein
MQADYTQHEVEVKRVENPLSETYDTVVTSSLIPEACARHLNKLHRAFAGVEAITRIITASMVEDLNDGGQPLSPYLVGGLMAGMLQLAEFAINDIEHLQSWSERQLEGGNANA